MFEVITVVIAIAIVVVLILAASKPASFRAGHYHRRTRGADISADQRLPSMDIVVALGEEGSGDEAQL